jgi:hypothetical protein
MEITQHNIEHRMEIAQHNIEHRMEIAQHNIEHRMEIAQHKNTITIQKTKKMSYTDPTKIRG